jgi:hypothetical protein
LSQKSADSTIAPCQPEGETSGSQVNLAVVVGVYIYAPRCHEEPICVDLVASSLVDLCDAGAPFAIDGGIAADHRASGAIRNTPPSDDKVVHAVSVLNPVRKD